MRIIVCERDIQGKVVSRQSSFFSEFSRRRVKIWFARFEGLTLAIDSKEVSLGGGTVDGVQQRQEKIGGSLRHRAGFAEAYALFGYSWPRWCNLYFDGRHAKPSRKTSSVLCSR
jgi:hypothetical protein